MTIDPKTCMHKMNFAAKFCTCRVCGQTWRLGQYGWDPVDPEYVYRARPKKAYYKKKKKKR